VQLKAQGVEAARCTLVDPVVWAELGEIVGAVDDKVDLVRADVDLGKRSPALARDVSEALLLCISIRDFPPQRPGCIRIVRLGDGACLDPECRIEGCRGNRVVGERISLVHTKTAGSRGTITLEVRAGSNTAWLLEQMISWARAEIVRDIPNDSGALFISPTGLPYTRAGFSRHITRALRLLLGVDKITPCSVRRERKRRVTACRVLTWHRPAGAQLRHLVATALSGYSEEQRAGA
jgi:hypothetical protein